ncbi:hypothetical protein CsatA_025221 [Cannabis sativa]
MEITRSSSSPSPVLKQKSKMGKKTLANKSKGKRPILEDYDSDFDAPLTKRGRSHSSKKTKLNVEEQTVPEISGKKSCASAEDRTQVWDYKFSPSDFYRSKCETNQLVEICFRGVKTIDHKAIEDAFLGSRWGLDESLGLKMVVLYFIQCFLLSNTHDKEVSRFDLDVVDSGRFWYSSIDTSS